MGQEKNKNNRKEQKLSTTKEPQNKRKK